VLSDAEPGRPPEPETTPEQRRQRALLLADLGRYDEAAEEIAAGLAVSPAAPDLLTTLARVHLVAEQPAEALVAADRAVAAAPHTIGPLVVRAMALADTRRFAEAAQIGVEVLRQWPDDAYAQRTGAALLSETRNGQEALNAAWGAVSLSPTDAEAHLVLGVVSARLRLFDLAQRAYAEALDLDPDLGDAQRDLGIVRLERRRWARALEQLAEAAVPPAPDPQPDDIAPSDNRAQPGPAARPDPDAWPDPSAGPPADRADPDAWPDARGASRYPDGLGQPDGVGRRERAGRGGGGGDSAAGARGPVWPSEVSRPSGSVFDMGEQDADVVRRTVRFGASAILIAGLVTALMATASSGASRVWAGMIGVVLTIALTGWLRRQLSEPLGSAFRDLYAWQRGVALAGWTILAAPLLFVVYAAVGGLLPLVATMAIAAAAELSILLRRD
jgi:Flp pilus assembly protein TadD